MMTENLKPADFLPALRSLILLMCLGILAPGFSQNTWKFEHYSYQNNGKNSALKQSMTMTGRHPLTSRLNFVSLVTVKNSLGGGNLGIDYQFRPWINVGFLAGYDLPARSVVLMPLLNLRVKDFAFTGAYIRIGEALELIELAVMAEKTGWKAGVIARNYFGVGPRLDLKLPRIPVWLWTAGLYEWEKEDYGLMLGLIMPFTRFEPFPEDYVLY